MGYIKAIIYGSNLELYTYEKNIRAIGGKRGNPTSRANMQDVPVSESVAEKEKISKRQNTKNRTLSAFRRLVIANNERSLPPVLITCTYAENQQSLTVGYRDFQSFITSMRHTFGKTFRYIAVPEFQRRGAVHFHALFWGLPENICAEERHTRVVARLWGRGFVDCFLTDGSDKLGSYLAKYLGKSYTDPRLFGKKAFRCSRNVIKPIYEKNLAGLYYLSEMYGIGVDNYPCIDREFDTQWLGKGRYRYYQNIKKNPNYVI